MDMKKVFLIVGLVVSLTGGGLLVYAKPTLAQPINIGLITSLTGPYSHLAKEQVNGATLAVKEINNQGGLLGREVVLQIRDDESRPDVGIRKFEELLQTYNIVAIVGAVLGSVDLAVSEKSNARRIPKTGKIILKTFQGPGKRPYDWGWQTDAIMGLAGSEYAVKNLGKRHYILYVDYVAGWDLLYAWEKGLKRYGGQLVGKDAVPLGVADFAPYLTKVLAASPDVLVLINVGMDTVNSVKQSHELGLKDKMKIIIPTTDGYPTLKAIGPKAMEGVYCGACFYWEIEKFHPTAKKFVAAYQSAYGGRPGTFAYNCYAGVHAWADAVRISKSLDGDAIVKVWGSPTFSFDHGKGKVRWRVPDKSAVEEWYICKGRSPADIAAEPDRIMDVVQVSGGREEYLLSLEELGFK